MPSLRTDNADGTHTSGGGATTSGTSTAAGGFAPLPGQKGDDGVVASGPGLGGVSAGGEGGAQGVKRRRDDSGMFSFDYCSIYYGGMLTFLGRIGAIGCRDGGRR